MATFAPEPQKSNDPSYLGTSQGTEKASFQPLASTPNLQQAPSTPNYSSDTTYGKIFAGVSDVLDTTVGALDKSVKIASEDELRTRLENVRNMFGVAQAQANPNVSKQLGVEGGALDNSGGSSIPKAVDIASNRLGNTLEGLKARYLNGDLQNSAYWNRAEAEVRAVRAQYKGYEEHIDKKSAEILGTIPANALRQSILQDVDTLFRKMQTAADKDQAFMAQHGDIIAMMGYPDANTMRAQGLGPSMPFYRDLVARHQAKVTATQEAIASLNLRDKQQGADVDTASPLLANELSKITYSNLQKPINIAGYGTKAPIQFFQDMQDQVASGKPLDDKQLTAVRNVFNQFKTNIDLQHEALINTNWDPNDPKSNTFNKLFSTNPNRLNEIKTRSKDAIAALEHAVTHPELGLLSSTSALIKAGDSEAERKMLDKFPVMKVLPGINQRIGPNAMVPLINGTAKGTPGILDMMIPVIRDVTKAQIHREDGGAEDSYGPTFQRIRELQDKPDAVKSGAAKATIDQGFKIILNSADPSMSVVHAGAMFSPKFNVFKAIDPPEEANRFYLQATHPDMIKRLQNLRSQPGGEEVWNNYVKWSGNNAVLSTKQSGDTATEAIQNGEYRVEYNPKTITWTAYPKFPVAMSPGIGGQPLSDAQQADWYRQNGIQPRLDDISRVLRNYAEVLKANGQTDPNNAIYGLANQLVNTAAPQRDGLFKEMFKAVQEGWEGAKNKVENIKSKGVSGVIKENTVPGYKPPPPSPLGPRGNTPVNPLYFAPQGGSGGDLGQFLANPTGDNNSTEDVRPVGTVNLTDQNIDWNSMDIKDIPDNLSARDFLLQLKRNPQGRRP
jgi:hypothetical protein